MTPKTILTLSAVGDSRQHPDGLPADPVLEAMLERAERSASALEQVIEYVWGPFAPPLTEAELRALHGDR